MLQAQGIRAPRRPRLSSRSFDDRSPPESCGQGSKRHAIAPHSRDGFSFEEIIMRAMQRHRSPSHEEVHRLWSAPGEEDGQDLHRHNRRKGHRKPNDAQSGRLERKVCQLCRQVAETLDEVLADCGDGVLRGLRVATVVPCPNASRLLVTVTPLDGRMLPEPGAKVVMDHLAKASGHLRYEIAASITRKRAPLLFYRLAEPALASAETCSIGGPARK
jgi:hypothetical protein